MTTLRGSFVSGLTLEGVTEGPLVRVLEKPLNAEKFNPLVNEFIGPTGPTRVAPPAEDEDLGPPPERMPLRSPPPDMGPPSDDDLPTGDTLDLDL